MREIAELEDPVGEIVESWTLPNGLEVRKQRAPLGVIGIVYEARPNVTIDAAALCLKSGNAAVLRGSQQRGDFQRVARRPDRRVRWPAAGLPDAVGLAALRAAAASSSASWRPRRAWST